jgi:small subunit ribosomal protein S16
MSVKIRLTRIGRHKDPLYRIVAADSRYARDGRYIEQLGYIDPSKGAENAIIDEELAMKWLRLGAQPSDSVRAMFNRKGIIKKFADEKKAKAPKKEKVEKTPVEKKAAKKVTAPKTATKKEAE